MSQTSSTASPPRRLTPHQRIARDREIGRAAAAGVKLPDLAEKVGLSVKQIRRIADAWAPDDVPPPALASFDVDLLARRMLDAHEIGLRTCVRLMQVGTPTVQVSAVRAIGPVSGALCDLLRGVGLLPTPDAIYARVKTDEMRQFLRATINVLGERGVDFSDLDEEVFAAIEAAKATPDWVTA